MSVPGCYKTSPNAQSQAENDCEACAYNRKCLTDILLPDERRKVDWLKKEITKRKMPVSIFRAKPCKGVGADRSVYLYQWEGYAGWIQGCKFWGGDHQERCDAAIAELQQFFKGL